MQPVLQCAMEYDIVTWGDTCRKVRVDVVIPDGYHCIIIRVPVGDNFTLNDEQEHRVDCSTQTPQCLQDDEFVLPPVQGPLLSYERKIRLHKYADNPARSFLGLNLQTHTIENLETLDKAKLLMRKVLCDVSMQKYWKIEWHGCLFKCKLTERRL
ncbi:unnamed protein product [Peronospora belbahrii]|uniref:Uncharacterized protein n=1 Tax=Peronospora belbahrii TaxID=622444 RepID=A0AAU9LB38_9STRA|nr:unnamed protein product [Peronospora belbahrii]